MNAKLPLLCCLISFLGLISVQAQNLPSDDEFDRALKACVAAQKIDIKGDVVGSITKLYASESARPVLGNPATFLLLIPEDMRIEAYRLYAECISKIVPQLASASTGLAPITTTYRICTGEYERACRNHDIYLYCGVSVEAWAKARCTSFTTRRLNSYGGNRCGYSLDEVICTGPK